MNNKLPKCIGDTKHNFKPLSDPYQKYKPEENSTSNGYNYRKREEYFPGISFVTLYCPACGKVIEVVAQNTTEKEYENATKEESKENSSSKEETSEETTTISNNT